jgi:hypothetical protein
VCRTRHRWWRSSPHLFCANVRVQFSHRLVRD